MLEKIRDGKVAAAGAIIGAVMKAMGGRGRGARARAGAGAARTRLSGDGDRRWAVRVGAVVRMGRPGAQGRRENDRGTSYGGVTGGRPHRRGTTWLLATGLVAGLAVVVLGLVDVPGASTVGLLAAGTIGFVGGLLVLRTALRGRPPAFRVLLGAGAMVWGLGAAPRRRRRHRRNHVPGAGRPGLDPGRAPGRGRARPPPPTGPRAPRRVAPGLRGRGVRHHRGGGGVAPRLPRRAGPLDPGRGCRGDHRRRTAVGGRPLPHRRRPRGRPRPDPRRDRHHAVRGLGPGHPVRGAGARCHLAVARARPGLCGLAPRGAGHAGDPGPADATARPGPAGGRAAPHRGHRRTQPRPARRFRVHRRPGPASRPGLPRAAGDLRGRPRREGDRAQPAERGAPGPARGISPTATR